MRLDFCTQFTKKSIIQEMMEVQGFYTMPYFLSGLSVSQFAARVEISCPAEGRVTSWPETMEVLLLNCAIATGIYAALEDFVEAHQNPMEEERTNATHLS